MSESVAVGNTSLAFPTGSSDGLGATMRDMDWSQCPLGLPETWSPSLRTTVGMMLAAHAQIVLFWGPHFVALYNDAYAPTIGAKHPQALGRPAIEHWAELWNDLEPLLVGVRDTGRTFSAMDRPFYIERHGYGETVYFDVSYSAVPEVDGSVGGVLCIVSETTARVLGTRRHAALLELEDGLRDIQQADDARTLATALLQRELGLESVDYVDAPADGLAQLTDASNDDPARREFPLLRGGKCVGSVVARHAASRRWSDEETHFARSVVDRSWSAAERTRAEALLRETQARQRQDAERVQMALAAGAIIGTWLWDFSTGRFTVDEKFAINFGLDPAIGRDNLTQEQIVATVHPDDRPGLEQAIAEAVKRGGSYAHQYRVRRADGRYYWVEANGRVDVADDGTPVAFPGVLIDLEERRGAEQKLAASEAKFRALFDEIDEGFCVIEFVDGPHGPLSDYTHVEANAAYAVNSGIEHCIGRTVREMVPDEAEFWVDVYRRVLLTGEPTRFEHKLEATGRYLELAAFRVGTVERRQVAVLFKDISARKQAEAELKGTNRELAERVAEAVAQREAAIARVHE